MVGAGQGWKKPWADLEKGWIASRAVVYPISQNLHIFLKMQVFVLY